MPRVREVMTPNLITVAPDATVAEAATLMGERRVSSLLVLDGDEFQGIFTERDIVRALSQDFDAPGHSVSEWMTRKPVTVDPEVTVREALDRMLTGGFRHLPVMEEGRLVGVVSIRDLSKASSEP